MTAPTSYTYQWQRNGTAISGATAAAYTCVSADVGDVITCTVTGINSAGNATATSVATATVIAAATNPPVNTVLPAITGNAQVGTVLTSSTGTWSNTPTSYAYQWSRTTPAAASVAATPVQSAVVPTGTSTTVSIGLSTSVTAGHLLTLAGTQFDNILISSVSGGGTWVKANATTTSTAGTVEQWYCLSATGGTTTVTVTLASAPGSARAAYMVTEWTGSWTYATAAATSNAGPSTTALSPSLTPSTAGELIIAHVAAGSAIGSPSTGWTVVNAAFMTNAYDVSDVVYIGSSSISTVQSTWTASSSVYYSSDIMSFLPASTSSPVTTAISAATSSTYTAQTADLGDTLRVAVTASNGSGSGTAVTSAPTSTVTSASTLPAAPTGPTAPTAGYRIVLADDFVGSTLDPHIWFPGREFVGAGATAAPFNSYEHAAYNSTAVTVSGSDAVLTCTPTALTVNGTTYPYTSGIISTANATNPFMFSPLYGGPFYIQARIKIPGAATGSAAGEFPAFWATSCRQWGATSNSNNWTREMDFFEFGSWARGPQSIDSVNLYPAGGYGTDTGNLTNTGAYDTATLGTDMSQAFHVYTVQINADGSFQLWIDGTSQWTLPAHTAEDYMCLLFNYGLAEVNGTGFTSDTMQIDYVMVWQSAAVTAGTGVLGGGIAAGTSV